jgi:hypothetical protein
VSVACIGLVPPGAKSENTKSVPRVGNLKLPPPASLVSLLFAGESAVDQITMFDGPSMRMQDRPRSSSPVMTRRGGFKATLHRASTKPRAAAAKPPKRRCSLLRWRCYARQEELNRDGRKRNETAQGCCES